ncbi:conserved hypothetical protein [Alkaliphilus metalliredigens QYMF]|uniref:Uncharacterized protein n=1 Tax=Alkaliphilus metalliredigens (strain QYMF) TaxID=293826 RepID=A6TMT6_ALKMQ|nr:DUF3006 domain-containing protein [Alkaliphilus metalliredigens]ABR47504.1 conserved hypothetical protein [Alkaliphilus metalliredigens QYMF]
MKVIIDRFEGKYVVVELLDQTMVDMPIQLVPLNAKEGDVLEIKVDSEETKRRKARITKLMDELWDK